MSIKEPVKIIAVGNPGIGKYSYQYSILKLLKIQQFWNIEKVAHF